MWCTPSLDMQSLMFLQDAKAFSKWLEEPRTATDTGYEEFIAIVDKYIRDLSPYEVNIESKTKSDILRATDRDIFNGFTLVRPPNTRGVM